jgi:hypothetical protein
VAGCGSNDLNGTIPQPNADTLRADLAQVQEAAARGDCATARSNAEQFKLDVNVLPATAGTDLKDALRDAGDQLVRLASDPSECTPSEATGETGAQTTGSSTTSTTSAPPTTTSTTTSSPTTTSTKEQPPPPAGGGGDENGGGNQGGGGSGGVGGGTGGTADSGGGD